MQSRILIVGPSRAGKNTFARLLAEALRLNPGAPGVIGDCGTELVRRLAQIRAACAAGTPPDERQAKINREADYIQQHKEDFRPDLRELGNVLRELNDAAVVNLCGDAPIVVGVRTKDELTRWMVDQTGTFVHIVWLWRPEQPLLSTIEFDLPELREAFGTSRCVAIYPVSNGSEEKLRQAAQFIAGEVQPGTLTR